MHLFRKFLLYSYIFLLSTSCLKAQSPFILGIDTTQSLGNFDYVFGMTTLPGGNLWVSGRCERTLSTSGGQVSNYGALLQITPTGNILTSQKSGFRSVNALSKTFDNNLLLGGEGSGFFCTSGLCKSDMLVAKVTSNYSVLWGRSFGNPNYNGSDGLKRVFQTSDSNIVVVGNIYQSSNNSHPFIAKLNGSNGDTIWTRAMGYPTNQFGSDASEGPNGELFLATSGDLRIFKLSSDGLVDWSKGFSTYGEVRRVFAQADGSVIAVGHHLLASSGDYVACMFKVSSGGTLEWFYDYSSPLPDINLFLHDVVFANGHFYLGGYQYSYTNFTGYFPLLIKTDSLGSADWALTFPSPVGQVKTLMPYPGSMICGIDYTPGSSLNNRPDIMIMPIDTSGNTSNTCLVPFTFTTSTPTINPISSSSGYYTDFETQVTPIAFSYQGYWETPTCLSTSLEDIPAASLFNVLQQNGQLIITPELENDYSIELFDITGRRLYYQENISGIQNIDMTSISQQAVILRVIQTGKSFSNLIVTE